MIDHIVLGIETAFQWNYLLYSLLGVIIGNLMGVLPGVGSLVAISLLLPVTYGMGPIGSLVMLSGIYYGASFGGSIASILLNLPGTAAHAVICRDGHPMAKQGRAGQAIFVSMFSSFVGLLVGVVIVAFFSPVMGEFALSFGSTEYFSVLLLGLIAAAMMVSTALLKSIASVLFGLFFSMVGTDLYSGMPRFTLGYSELTSGITLVAIAMGLFGMTEILKNAGKSTELIFTSDKKVTGSSIRPDKGEIKKTAKSFGRGSLVGSFFGILPGAGQAISAFLGYALEQRVSKEPQRFGRGAVEGIAGAESGNSSAAITAFIPTLTLGIPGSAVMALMLGALMIQGITPGPQVISENPALFWGLVMSFVIGGVMLVVLNIPLVGVWVKLLSVPYRIIYPTILVLMCIGAYSVRNSLFDVGVFFAIGMFGCVLYKLRFAPEPLLLGFVLGPMIEEHFRRAMQLSSGNFMTFIKHPLSAACLAICLVILVGPICRKALRWSGQAVYNHRG